MFLSGNLLLRFSRKAVLVLLFLISPVMYAQLNGTYTIPGSYATVAAAITALNTSGVSGPVVFNVTAGHTETLASPTAGTITATGTASNTITFQKSGTGANPVITAGVGTTSNTDGIIKIAGGDYITFDGIDLAENSLNTNNTTLMEWGYALLKKSATAPFDGCQYVTIKNCTVTMNKVNTVSIAVYAGNHIATSTTALTITATTDAMNNITIDNVMIRNTFGGISITGYNASSPYTLYSQNIEIKNCNIQNLGSSGGTSGIIVSYYNGLTIYNNTIINDGAGGSPSNGTLTGISLGVAVNSNVTVRSNTLQLSCADLVSSIIGINNNATGTVIINSNIMQNFVAGGTAGSLMFIRQNASSVSTVTIDSNIIRNCTSLNASNAIYFIYLATATNNYFVRYNTINNIARITATNGSTFGIFNNGSPTGGTATITNNTISNITSSTVTATNGSNGFYGIYHGTTTAQTANINNNTIFNLTGGSGGVIGIFGELASLSSTINNNSIYNLSSLTGIGTYGIYTGNYGSPWTISGNTVRDLSATGAPVAGIYLKGNGSTPMTVSKNNIFGLSISATSVVTGIYFDTGNMPMYAYNNYISDLRAPSSTSNRSIVGIYIASGNLTQSHGLYYNTVYLNAASTASGFGSACVFWETSYGLDMRNNILVNMSSAGNGSTLAKTAIFRRSDTALSNYALTSNNNLMYVNPGAASKAYFMNGTNYDSTLAAYKTRMATRDQNSVSELPPFINTTTTPYNLHLSTTTASLAGNSGTPVSTPVSLTDDFDGEPRNATTPDIGADEYSMQSLNSLLRLTALVEGLYNTTSNTMIADTIKVYLRRAANPYTVVDSSSVLLSTAGQGVYSFTKSIRDSSFYLQLYNKRALETWSKTPVLFSTDTVSYDFTTAANKAFGDNQVLKGTKYCLYSGDANGDGVIDFGDLIQIDNDNANFVTGDSSSDLNGDGVVDLTDMLIADNNNANFISRITPLTAKRPAAKRVTVTGEMQKTGNGATQQK